MGECFYILKLHTITILATLPAYFNQVYTFDIWSMSLVKYVAVLDA